MRIFAVAAVLALTAAPAFAQSSDPSPFNGFFAGVQGGWQQDRQRLDVTDNGVLSSATAKKSGLSYGGQFGYDLRLTPNVVAGLEASATGRTGADNYVDGFGNSYRLKSGRTLGASARLGYLVSPGGLVYGRAGYANARFNLDTAGGRISEDRDGYVLGVGYEQVVARNVSARVEYDYSRFGSDDLPGLATNVGADSARLNYNRNAVTAGLNFRF